MDKRHIINEHDVISVSKTDLTLVAHTTFKLDDFFSAISENLSVNLGQLWCCEGVDCEVLSPGKTWQKGKVKISLEFIPDESEYQSPLDEIREHPSFSTLQ